MTAPLLLIGPRLVGAPTGARVCFEMLLDYLDNRGMNYRVIDFGGGGDPETGGELKAGRIIRNLNVVWQAMLQIPRSRRVYLIISMSRAGAFRDLLVTGWAIVWRKPYTLHLHGGGYPSFMDHCPQVLRLLLRKILLRADRILVLSQDLVSDFAFSGMDPRRVRVAPNGIPANTSIDGEAKHLQTGSTVQLLYLSNMIESKGFRDLLAACRILSRRGTDRLECHFCGAFPTSSASGEQVFMAEIRSPELAGKIHYHGSVSGADKTTMLRKAHVLVLPTRYPGEGQPMSIIEALASATPVIATSHRSIPDLLGDGECGVLIETENEPELPVALANAIESLISDPQRYAALSLAARRRFEQNYRAEQTMLNLVQEGVLGE